MKNNMEVYMEYIVLAIIIVVFAMAAVLIIKSKKKSENNIQESSILPAINKSGETVATDERLQEIVIQMETLPVESINDHNKLVEITDSKILARVDNLVPQLAQVRNAAHNAAQAVKKSGEILYKIDIPMNALVKSKEKEGAFRAFSRGANGIQKNANLIPQKMQQGTEIVANTASAAMGIASMVVGQYYMSQINAELGVISDGISKISDFQNNEYRSRVFSLVAHIKKIADFQVEILENEELRLSKISQLDSLEEECTKLLGQANLTLVDYSEKRDLDYDSYEKELKEAQKWYMYQKSLTEVLYRISDLRYTLHLGAVSREQCVALLPTYSRQVEETKQRLAAWHNDTTQSLKIDTCEMRRKREGLDGVIHFIPGLFNDNFNFKAIEENTAEMIKTQSEEHHDLREYDTSDLYSEDVQLIVKGEKLYYLPSDDKKADCETNNLD